MPANQDFVGRTFPATKPYEVSRVKIAEFADANWRPEPRSTTTGTRRRGRGLPGRDRAAHLPHRGDHGAHRRLAVADPELGINYAMVVRMASSGASRPPRPLRAGDVVTAQSTIESIRQVGSNVLMTTRTDLQTVAGEHVCTAFSIIVERGGVGVA